MSFIAISNRHDSFDLTIRISNDYSVGLFAKIISESCENACIFATQFNSSMIQFFRSEANTLYAVGMAQPLQNSDIQKLTWLFGGAEPLFEKALNGNFIGPRKEMITPWSTNAVEITQTMGITGIQRIEEFKIVSSSEVKYDRMLEVLYTSLDQEIFTILHLPEPIIEVEDIAAYSKAEGLALSAEEIDYLENVGKELGRKLTDSEVFGFSQVNSEHCRHKIFNGTFIIDGQGKPFTLFQLIKKTSKENPNLLDFCLQR